MTINLLKFFVYNPILGREEGKEFQKILFYYPVEPSDNQKIKDVGLCEAIVTFARTFSTDKPCESLHTQKTRQLFFEAEPGYWLLLVVSIPHFQKLKESQTFLEYREDDVHDDVYLSVLKLSYHMFRLFMGTFSSIVEKAGVHNLKLRLGHFFPRYLQTVPWDSCDVLDVFNGIQFLPLDKNTYLRVQSFLNQVEANFPQVKFTAFLYNDSLVWSGLEQDDIRILYKYLTTSLFPSHLETELLGGQISPTPKASVPQEVSTVHYGKFITGPPDLNDTSNLGKVPRIFVNVIDGKAEECTLLVYRALSASVCLIVDASYQLNFDFFRQIHQFLGPELSKLASDIGEQYSKRLSNPGDTQKYIYFNHMNLAQKSSVHLDMNKKIASTAVPSDVLQLVSDVQSDLAVIDNNAELIVKGASDFWVVGKKSDQRELCYINPKCNNLIEIHEEVKKLCASHFNNIFFLD